MSSQRLERLFAVISAAALIGAGCSNPNQTVLRAPRQGAQRDAAGRTYFEFREVSAHFCAQEGFDEARTERGARDRLTSRAQEMGYSGVREVACTTGAQDCATGKTCRGISVRYVIPRADGTTPEPQRGACEPACEGTATCQDGQCVAQCNPPCTGGRACVQDGTCVQID
ncbi:MAG: hypothetical protein JNK05_05870 [Myxococcales bacterium]|nr:hypothetical protein [Myxococcales bacterium]